MELPWRVKLRQAERHLRTFEADCDEYVTSSRAGFDYDVDRAAGSISVRLRADFEPPMALGAVVGDVLHNLRSALDSIAWETCRRAGVSRRREAKVQFPIARDASKWPSLADDQLPNVADADRQVFRELQPWHFDEIATSFGIEVDPDTVERQPLYRLHELAKTDRHRVPHPVLARAGMTSLSAPEGVETKTMRADPPPWVPGSVMFKWLIDPPSRVLDAQPDGTAILALSEDGALHGRSAVDDLQSMRDTVTQALRRIEVEVLGVVTPEQMAELSELRDAFEEARSAFDSLRQGDHVIDADYVERFQALHGDHSAARERYTERWRELFE